MDILLPAAARALALENGEIEAAFDLSPRSDEHSGKLNRSLAYWLFETTLAYIIFKSWLPLADVDWEVSYPDHNTEKADLVVHGPSDANGTEFPVVIECKWWMNTGTKTTTALEGDIRKLRTWTGNARRVLLTFWHSPDDAEDRDWKDVEDFCARQTGVSVFWTARFRIHHHEGRRHFATAALEVV